MYKNKLTYLLLVWLVLLPVVTTYAQTVSGYVYDENNSPVPYVNVYVKHTDWGTTTDGNGRYFIDLDKGDYEIVFSAVGYTAKTVQVILKSRDIVKNVWINSSTVELDALVVKANQRDPAYGIMKNAIAHKKKYAQQYQSSICEVYIKAREDITEKERKKREENARRAAKEKKREEEEKEKLGDDPFAARQREKNKELSEFLGSMNMFEVKLTRNYQFPNQVKEIRTASKTVGSKRGLYFRNTAEAEFNFYRNLMQLDDLNETPLVSPLNNTAVLTYKFKLIEAIQEEGKLVYKIKITPRKAGNAAFSGFIWIVDGLWNIKRIDLNLHKGGLLYYDDFRIQQGYEIMEDSLWVMNKQEFNYASKTGRTTFKGHTVALYSDYQINPTFPKRYFKNEVAVTTDSAYKRDTTYWEKIRPLPLTKNEQKLMFLRDSIKAAHNTEAYLDSVDGAYNKLTVGKILYHGIGHRNRIKKKEIYIGSLWDNIEPFELGGLRVGPYFTYFNKNENEKYFFFYQNLTYGLRNQDVKGDAMVRLMYDPMHMGRITFRGGKEFELMSYNDGITSLFTRSNWMEEAYGSASHSRELFNGFYTYTDVSFSDRSPISGYEFGQVTENWVENNVPLEFETTQSLTSTFYISYTPGQKYITEPHRKVVLGSKFPTFTLYYDKGWKDAFGSDIDYDYVSAQITQTFKISTLGTSKYKVKSGFFLNDNKIEYMDQKIFPRGDKLFYSNPLNSYQLQDTTLTSRDIYVEGHYIHHFNGAIINYVPLIKKLRIKAVAGGGFLWIKESDYRYIEGFVGIERTFRLERQRYRLGAYFVVGDSNFNKTQPAFKISITRFSNREKKWGF